MVLNFSALRPQSAAGRLARAPLRLIPREARLPILQGPLRGKRWIAGSLLHGCWLGSYELDKQRRFARLVQPGHVVCDVGANVGFYSLLGAHLAGPEGVVYAFEPLPRNVRYLREHLRLNAVNNVLVFEVAVSNCEGVAFFDETPHPSMGSLSPAGGLQVDTVTLDGMISAGRMRPPDVVKIDVEGAEALVLEGARRLLETARPVIFLATHGPEVHRECLAILREAGYRVESIGGGPVDTDDELLATPS